MTEILILVDEKDNQIGCGEKLAVHKAGKLHRCFSIFVFNRHKEVLMQKRATTKYHSGGLWTNTCCGHPLDGEQTDRAAHRRLQEEMGFDCEMDERFSFIYQAQLDHGLTEHEFDHVFIGKYDGEVIPCPQEADDYRWQSIDSVLTEMKQYPERYTVWSIIAFKEIMKRNILN